MLKRINYVKAKLALVQFSPYAFHDGGGGSNDLGLHSISTLTPRSVVVASKRG